MADENIASEFISLVRKDPIDTKQIAELLDNATHEERVATIRSLGGLRLQRRLFRAAKDAEEVCLDQLVPPDHDPLKQVIYYGKNSLLAFTKFQKRFSRPSKKSGRKELWGYNHQALAPVTGPGYYVVYDTPGHPMGGVAIDYREVPPEKPERWPEIKGNAQGLSRLIYNNMVDYLRRVSKNVLIGSATRGGKETGNYFLLCRED